jgi:3-hydroxybutyryl-CoA dehydrogenase
MAAPQVIGIVGEGKMGTNLFNYLLGFDFSLRWLVSGQADCDKITAGIMRKLCRQNEVERDFIVSKEPVSLAGCDLVIEAIPEDREAKKKLFTILDNVVAPGCIMASNSSSILPSGLVPSEVRKDKTVGLHFFYPVSLKNVVELVITSNTGSTAIESCEAFLKKIRRFYLVQDEDSAFVLNRIYLEFQLEAWKIVEGGIITIPAVDRLVHENISPAGIFDFFDAVGIDVILPSIRNYIRNYSEQGRYDSLIKKMESMIIKGELGAKSGKGFYSYPPGSEETSSDPGVETDARIVARLKESLSGAIRDLHRSQRYPVDDLIIALKEYIGNTEIALL